MTAAVQTTSATVHHAVVVYCHASVNLCLSQPAACMTTTKRTGQNLFVPSGKSEVELALDVL